MQNVTGQTELKTENAKEIERFVQEHLAELEGREIIIRRNVQRALFDRVLRYERDYYLK
jgi:hypothetical protein